MATKKKKFMDELGEDLNDAPIKKALPDTDVIKKIAKKEHNQTEEVVPKPKKPMKRITRTTFDFPTPIHQNMKKAAADEYLSLKDYVVMVVKKDLKERGYIS